MALHRPLTLGLLLGLLAACTAPEELGTLSRGTHVDVPWAFSGSPFRIEVTLDNTGLPELADFPVLLRGSGPPGDASQLPAVTELRFADAAGTPLGFEVEKWTPTESLVWLRVPALPANGITYAYLYFGAPVDTAALVPPVWDADHRGVWHFAQVLDAGVPGAVKDSSVHGMPGRSANAVGSTEGPVGLGASFGGDGAGFIEVGKDLVPDALRFSSPLTIETWLRLTSPVVTGSSIVSNADGGTGYRLSLLPGSPHPGVELQVGSGVKQDGLYYLGISSFQTWTHLAATWTPLDAGSLMVVYFDGLPVTQAPLTGSHQLLPSDRALRIGAVGGTPGIPGALDELRISSTARSADWMRVGHAWSTEPRATFGCVEDRATLDCLGADGGVAPMDGGAADAGPDDGPDAGTDAGLDGDAGEDLPDGGVQAARLLPVNVGGCTATSGPLVLLVGLCALRGRRRR